MPDRHDGSLSILIVDDRSANPLAWSIEATRLDVHLSIHCVDHAAAIQQALLDGRWLAVLCRAMPSRLSVSAVLAMTHTLDPAPPVLLFPDVRTASDRRAWLSAALRASGRRRTPPRSAVVPPTQGRLDLGTMDIPSIFGTPISHSISDVEAMRALRASEERFRTLTEIAPVGIFLTDAEQHCVYVNERWSEITGVKPRDAAGLDWRTCLQTKGSTLQATSLFASDPTTPLAFESLIERSDRRTWVMGQLRPYRDPHGAIVGHLGVITDITDRKTAEMALQRSEQRLRELSIHMTSVEERQRAQIAREIHDDIGSSLTGMKIDLLRLKQLTEGVPEAQEKIAACNRLLDSTAASSVRIAKALRPSILDDGIVPAIEWQLREFAKRMDIDTEFVEPDEEPQLTQDQSIALFRVVQEALNNVAKHAAARHVDVVLFTRGDELTVEIRDDGKGLPTGPSGERIERRRGTFGITGMRERIHSLGGWIDVTGAPGKGTTVMAGIPLHVKVAS